MVECVATSVTHTVQKKWNPSPKCFFRKWERSFLKFFIHYNWHRLKFSGIINCTRGARSLFRGSVCGKALLTLSTAALQRNQLNISSAYGRVDCLFFFFYFEFCFYDNNTLPSVGRKEIDFYIGSRSQDSYVAWNNVESSPLRCGAQRLGRCPGLLMDSGTG